MSCQFDQVIDRRNTCSRKWDGILELYGDDNLLPMWIADMDFLPPKGVVEAITNRAAHGIFGYESRPQGYLEAVVGWLKKRHNWEVEREWISHSPGVVTGLALAVLAVTEPGEKIVIQPPVYPPFYWVVHENQRVVVESPLNFTNGKFSMDFVSLEKQFRAGVKTMILCAPHNPVGRVWTATELNKLAELVLEYEVIVLSDEIWSDLTFPAHPHLSLASLSPEIAAQTFTFTAPSKTFNLAAFYHSNNIIPNPKLREKFEAQKKRLGLTHLNLFGLAASEVAYREGEEWLDRLLAYVEDNMDYVIAKMAKIAPQIKIRKPEGTFLLWLDGRELGIPPQELNEFFVAKAGIALNDGKVFGPEGNGWQRMNVATPRAVIDEALQRIAGALGK